MAQLILLISTVALTRSYFIGPDRLTWDESEAYCNRQDSNLASIHSASDLDTVSQLCYEHPSMDMDCHIGMQFRADGKWHWIDGTSTDFAFNTDGTVDQNHAAWEGTKAGDAADNEICHKVDIKWLEDEDYNYGLFDDTYCDSHNPPICNGEPTCEEIHLDDVCAIDSDCPNCMRCCKGRKVCEWRPGFQPAFADQSLNYLGGYNINNVTDKNGYNYYGYILLIGVIVFILINNVFIGCWCLQKGKYTKYQKCDMVSINNEI